MPNIGASRISFLAKTAATVTAEAQVIRKKTGLSAISGAVIDTTTSKFGGSSLTVGATNGRRVEAQYDSRFDFGSDQDFTIEAWVRSDGSWSSDRFVISSDASGGYFFGLRNGTDFGWGRNAVAWDYNTAHSMSTDTWYHVAWVRSGNSLYLFRDGTQIGTTQTSSQTYDLNSGKLNIGAQGSNYAWSGWIDEIRISKTARYTSNFTQPTGPFINDENTLLLVHANGTDDSTYFEDDNGVGGGRAPVLVSTSGNAQISTAESQFGGSSVNLDGTNSYWTVPYTNDLVKWNQQAYTVEYWVRLDSLSGTSYADGASSEIPNGFGHHNPTDNINYWSFGPIDDGSVVFFYYNGGKVILQTSSVTLSTNTWYHLAFVYDGSSNIKIYVDGTERASGTVAGSPQFNTGIPLTHGAAGSSTVYMNGYTDEFRISNTARYTSDFTPSTTPFTRDANTLLLLHMNGANGSTHLKDDAGSRPSRDGIGFGDVQLDTSRYKFGQSSALFDGTGDYIVAPYDSTTLGTGAFTWECFFNVDTDAGSGTVTVLSNRNGSGVNGNIQMLFRNLDMKIQVNGYGGSSAFNANGVGNALATDTWHHYAFCRNETNAVAVFVNGTRVSSGTWDASVIADNNDFGIGAHTNGGIPINSGADAWIDGVRVSNIDRYGVDNSSITVPTERFTNDPNTELLIQMDGSDGNTVFLDDNGVGNDRPSKTVTVNNNAQIKTDQSQFGGSSAYFDGTDDSIQVPNGGSGGDFDFSSKDFTVECFVRPASVSGVRSFVTIWGSDWNNDDRIWFFGSNGDELVFYYYTGDNNTVKTTVASTSSPLSVDTWHHVAVTGDSTNFKLYVDGTEVDSESRETIDPLGGDGALAIGATSYDAFDYQGYIDEVRISNNVRYNAAFTAPTEAFTHDANTVLLLHMDGADASTTFVDTAGSGRSRAPIEANGNAQIDTAQYKFGNASALFDGTDDWLEVDGDSNFDLSGDFTIEFFARMASTSGNQKFLDFRPSGTSSTSNILLIDHSTNFRLFVDGSDRLSGAGGSATQDTWHHIAVVRSGSDIKYFLDGGEQLTYTQSSIKDYTLDYNFAIGINGETRTDQTLNGHMDELRISKTARYTGNFTVPTAQFQNDANTLLLMHMDGTDGSTVFVDDNGMHT